MSKPESLAQARTEAALAARRQPTQERGRNRVAVLLAATGELLEEVGYEAVTTKAIAARAHTSIGSFYQFFPNKDAAVSMLVEGYRQRIREFLFDSFDRGGLAHDGITVGRVAEVIDGLGNIYRSLPGFRGVWFGRLNEGPLREQAASLRREIIDSLDELLATAFPEVSAETRHRSVSMVVETAKLLLTEAGQDDDRGSTVREELHRMLGLYLADRFHPAQRSATQA